MTATVPKKETFPIQITSSPPEKKVLPQNLTGDQLIKKKNSPPFKEPERSIGEPNLG
jgi:hypothetical protein